MIVPCVFNNVASWDCLLAVRTEEGQKRYVLDGLTECGDCWQMTSSVISLCFMGFIVKDAKMSSREKNSFPGELCSIKTL